MPGMVGSQFVVGVTVSIVMGLQFVLFELDIFYFSKSIHGCYAAGKELHALHMMRGEPPQKIWLHTLTYHTIPYHTTPQNIVSYCITLAR